MSHSVLSVGCRVVLIACEQLGLHTTEMLRKHGLSRAQVDDPDGRLPPEAVRAVWDEAIRESGDPHLALRVAQSIPPGAYRMLEYMIASAPTVGVAFSKLGEYFSWIDTSVRLPVGQYGDVFALGIELDAPPERVPLRALEFTFSTSLRCAKTWRAACSPNAASPSRRPRTCWALRIRARLRVPSSVGRALRPRRFVKAQRAQLETFPRTVPTC